jgi:hypothetical protein
MYYFKNLLSNCDNFSDGKTQCDRSYGFNSVGFYLMFLFYLSPHMLVRKMFEWFLSTEYFDNIPVLHIKVTVVLVIPNEKKSAVQA